MAAQWFNHHLSDYSTPHSSTDLELGLELLSGSDTIIFSLLPVNLVSMEGISILVLIYYAANHLYSNIKRG